MVIEIGTSDFRTLAGVEEGIFIEPIKCYYDSLPDCDKLNVAISNYSGKAKAYYIEPADIERYGLPNWIRGCNSIHEVHPTVIKEGYEKYVKEQEIYVRRIGDVIEEFGVKEIEFLKIDTEGHDTVILKDYLNTVDILPQKIQFEANTLANMTEVYRLIRKLKYKGYKVKKGRFDVVCELL